MPIDREYIYLKCLSCNLDVFKESLTFGSMKPTYVEAPKNNMAIVLGVAKSGDNWFGLIYNEGMFILQRYFTEL